VEFAVTCQWKLFPSLVAAVAFVAVGGGEVFIGNNCIDSGVGRGYVDAFDVERAKHRWRFYTVPGAPPAQGYQATTMEIAAKTWGTGEWWKTAVGCGSA
jgi:hypothetical protein